MISDNFSGESEGLLGVWNDDETDDLLTANGTTLAKSSSQEVIFHEFGESCNSLLFGHSFIRMLFLDYSGEICKSQDVAINFCRE